MRIMQGFTGKRVAAATLLLCVLLIAASCDDQGGKEIVTGSWRTEYTYSDPALGHLGIATAAVARLENGKVVAEAKLLRLVTEEENRLAGAEVEEIHYNLDGKVVFRCKTVFDFPLGRRMKETNTRGIKHTEYFGQWPMMKW